MTQVHTEEPATEEVQDALIDQVVDGRYRVLERIGRGGMGVVYKVEHTRIGKIAAMKLLHANLVSDRDLRRRFQAEAEAISKLTHPNIVQVFDFGRSGETVYLVMEYLKGEDLGAIIRRDGGLALPRSAGIVAQICDALAEAHDIGIIHRDLKPENIRVSRTADGHDFIKVLDFGLAKMIEGEQQPGITAHGSLVGTPYYMAPEQIRADKVDQRADIYSLGALLYHMLTGKQAFAAKTPMGVLTRHITEEVVPPSQSAPGSGLTADVDALVTRALAKKPDQRFSSALELKHALVAVAATTPSGEVSLLAGRTPAAGDPAPGRRVSDSQSPLPPAPGPQPTELGYLPTGVLETPTTPPGVRLAREDLAFERRLRRARAAKLLLVVLPLLAALGLGAYYWLVLKDRPLVAPLVEAEPNDDLQQATLLATGKPVSGHLGRRVSATESDRDWYRLRVDTTGVHTLTARISGIPNMDLTLELYDAIGGRVYTADSAGTGGGEVITNYPIGPGKHFLLVREMWKVGARPTENVTDSYRLRASWTPQEPGWELEPNDRPRQATALEAGKSIRGFVGGLGDRDGYALSFARDGKLAASVSGVVGVDLVLELYRGKKRIARADRDSVSGAESLKGLPVKAASELRLVVRRKLKNKPEGRGPGGLTEPYTLKVWLE